MQLGRNRIEALKDGVFAVAMTLLVLDIKVPELQQPLATAELPLKLVALWPKFLSYTISFVILLGPSSKIWKSNCRCLGSQPELIKDALDGHANGFVVPIDRSGILCTA